MRKILAIVFLTLVISPAVSRQPRAQKPGGTSSAQHRAQAMSRSTPEKQGVSSAGLLAFIEAADKDIDTMHSFMVLRHGQVVAEAWWAPFDAGTPHILFSLSKSFTSTAVGLAVAEGKFSLDDEVWKFFPEELPAEPSANLKAMRVRDLLRMNTGHQTEAQLFRSETAASQDLTWVRKFFAHPVPFKPGTHFLYNSPATYMLSAIVQKTTGQTVLDYLGPRLFAPLGFEQPSWVASPQGVSAGAYGLMLRTEEIARFGQLYLRKGAWNGRQLLPLGWVESATALQTSNGSSPLSDWDQGYGYQFWRSRHNSYRGDGAFGQYCLVIPELDAVVAITSGVRDMQRTMNLVWEKLLPAMKTGKLPEDAAAERMLKARLAGLSVRPPAGRAASAASARVSKRWFDFPENTRGIRAASIDFDSKPPVLIFRTAAGEVRTRIGVGMWEKSVSGFANGIEQFLSAPKQPMVGASGAWTADDVFTVKLIAYETPFSSTLSFRFEGERLLLDAEHNVAFGPTKLAQLVGQSSASR